MESLELATAAAFDTHWEVRFGLRHDLGRTADSLAFTLEGQSGRELTVRVERGRVADVAVWDAPRARRVTLPLAAAVVGYRDLVCVVPAALLIEERARARMQLNGATAGLATVAWEAAESPVRELASA